MRPPGPGYGSTQARPASGAARVTALSAFEATLLEDDDLSNDPKTGRKRDRVRTLGTGVMCFVRACVRACVCVCVCVCVHMYTRTCVCVRVYTCAHASLSVLMHYLYFCRVPLERACFVHVCNPFFISQHDYICAVCEREDNLLPCEGPCLRSFHRTCLGLPASASARFVCRDCKTNQVSPGAFSRGVRFWLL